MNPVYIHQLASTVIHGKQLYSFSSLSITSASTSSQILPTNNYIQQSTKHVICQAWLRLGSAIQA